MGLEFVPLLTPQQLLQEMPLTERQVQFIAETQSKIRNILDGSDDRILLIVGPCSIHNVDEATEYAHLLKNLSDDVSDVFLILMRVYFEKPRSKIGWTGFLYDPYLNGSHDIPYGLRKSRELLLTLASMGMPAATEFLDPINAVNYIKDLISWGCIGARTASSQPHRQLASSLPMPIAFKNNTDGNIQPAINGILSSSLSHTYIGLDLLGQISTIKTTGNPYGHLVLRGGEKSSNFDPHSIVQALNALRAEKLDPRLLIDCSHDNSLRRHENQIPVFQSAIHQFAEGNNSIRGMLLESNLQEGNQVFGNNPSLFKKGVSLTDPCLDWNSTEQLIRWGYSLLKRDKQTCSEEFFPTHEIYH